MNFVLDILFPKRCVGCKAYGSYLCQNCIYEIKQKDLICPECERPSLVGKTHPYCQGKYSLDGLWSLGAYQGRLKSAITALKYKSLPQLADILANITLDYWQRHEPYFLEETKQTLVTAVPLHWYRKNKRGFNQAELIARKLGLKYIEVLKRVKYTKPQVKLEGDQRRENIKNAFALSGNNELLTNNYLLIDDVWTTGSTLRECCSVLKKAGVKGVWALTLAR